MIAVVWNVSYCLAFYERNSLAFILARVRIFNVFYTIAFTPDAVQGYGFERFLQIMIIGITIISLPYWIVCCHFTHKSPAAAKGLRWCPLLQLSHTVDESQRSRTSPPRRVHAKFSQERSALGPLPIVHRLGGPTTEYSDLFSIICSKWNDKLVKSKSDEQNGHFVSCGHPQWHELIWRNLVVDAQTC